MKHSKQYNLTDDMNLSPEQKLIFAVILSGILEDDDAYLASETFRAHCDLVDLSPTILLKTIEKHRPKRRATRAKRVDPNAKLNWVTVRAMRAEPRKRRGGKSDAGGLSVAQIAAKYGTSYNNAKLILDRITWRAEPRGRG